MAERALALRLLLDPDATRAPDIWGLARRRANPGLALGLPLRLDIDHLGGRRRDDRLRQRVDPLGVLLPEEALRHPALARPQIGIPPAGPGDLVRCQRERD